MTQNDFDTGIGLKPEAGRPKMAYFGLRSSVFRLLAWKAKALKVLPLKVQ